MQIILFLITLAVAAACFRGLRKLGRSRFSVKDLTEWIDAGPAAYRPMERLLDPEEFESLRQHGLSAHFIRQLRARRRAIFRMYLRHLTRDFSLVCAELRRAIVNAEFDCPDLAGLLAEQSRLFFGRLIGAELRLMLNAAGFHSTPTMELVRPLERLRLAFNRVAAKA